MYTAATAVAAFDCVCRTTAAAAAAAAAAAVDAAAAASFAFRVRGGVTDADVIAHTLPALFREELLGREKADTDIPGQFQITIINLSPVTRAPSSITDKETPLHVDVNL